MKRNDLSLADFIVLSHGRVKQPITKAMLWAFASQLAYKPRRPIVRKFVYDKKVEAILQRLSFLPFEDFVAQHHRIVMPFDTFWIENTPPEKPLSFTMQRKGLLLRKSPYDDTIRAKYAMEFTTALSGDTSSALQKATADFMRQSGAFYIQDNRYVLANDRDIVFEEKGISFDTQSSVLEGFRQMLPEALNLAGAEQKQFDTTIAQDIYRLLILISSRNVRSSLAPWLIREPPEGQEKDTRYRATGLPPMAVLTPITLDLARDLERAIDRLDGKGVKALLGWTDVIRHPRTYHTIEGPIVRIIEPHDRRIPAPIDRRGAPRALTSSEPDLTVDLQGERPRLVHGRHRKHKFEKR